MIEGTEFGHGRPGVQVSDFDTGPRLVRDWSGGFGRQTYSLELYLDGLVPGVDDWAAFLRNTRNGIDPFIVVEPVKRVHHDLPLYPLPDGSRTFFYAPINTVDELIVTADGVPQSLGQTVPSAFTQTNALSAEQAICTPDDDSDSLSGVWDSALGSTNTFKALAAAALVGKRGVLLDKSAPAPGHGIENPSNVDITDLVHINYNIMAGAWVMGSGDFRANLELFTSGTPEDSGFTDVTVTDGVWSLVSTTVNNSTGYIDQAKLTLTHLDATPNVMMIDAPFITTADAPAWTDPRAPMFGVELLTAPAAGVSLRAHGVGYRASLVRASRQGAAWAALATGRGVPDGLEVVEELPGDA